MIFLTNLRWVSFPTFFHQLLSVSGTMPANQRDIIKILKIQWIRWGECSINLSKSHYKCLWNCLMFSGKNLILLSPPAGVKFISRQYLSESRNQSRISSGQVCWSPSYIPVSFNKSPRLFNQSPVVDIILMLQNTQGTKSPIQGAFSAFPWFCIA